MVLEGSCVRRIELALNDTSTVGLHNGGFVAPQSVRPSRGVSARFPDDFSETVQGEESCSKQYHLA